MKVVDKEVQTFDANLKVVPNRGGKIMNVYSGAGARPRTAPLPTSSGLMYKEPLPVGGTWMHKIFGK